MYQRFRQTAENIPLAAIVKDQHKPRCRLLCCKADIRFAILSILRLTLSTSTPSDQIVISFGYRFILCGLFWWQQV